MTPIETPSDDTAIIPFTVDVAEAQLEDLAARLRHTRWPDEETVAGTDRPWGQGMRLRVAQELAAQADDPGLADRFGYTNICLKLQSVNKRRATHSGRGALPCQAASFRQRSDGPRQRRHQPARTSSMVTMSTRPFAA